MGWSTDWLYGLIFKEIKRLAARAQDGDERAGPPPSVFHVCEYDVADWETVQCRGAMLRRWTLIGGELSEASDDELPDLGAAEIRGRYFPEGLFAFHISADRKQVLFTYYFGPLHARGLIFNVRGQGKQGRLEPSDGRSWIS